MGSRGDAESTESSRRADDRLVELAHELRSPLSGLRGFAAALSDRWHELDDAARLTLVASIKADADRLDRLIVDILTGDRVAEGALTLSCRPTAAEPLLDDLVASTRATTSRPVTLALAPSSGAGESTEPTADLTLQIDPDRFAQVITNLLRNAVEHGSGAIVVRAVRVRRAKDEADWCRVSVADEGPGMPPASRAAALTRGWSTKPGGTGLGLFLAAGILQAHGGELSIEMTGSGGTEVVTIWPLALH